MARVVLTFEDKPEHGDRVASVKTDYDPPLESMDPEKEVTLAVYLAYIATKAIRAALADLDDIDPADVQGLN